jgi:hypothetical protein
MPNWVYNGLTIEGNKEDIAKLKAQLNQPFTRIHENWDTDTNSFITKEVSFSNPVFAFWNIIKPTNLEAYNAPADSNNMDNSNNWYPWNNRNWGVKWDVAISDGEEYPETELYDESDESLSYRFNTAWGIPNEALITLSSQYPDLSFTLEFEEETGWGGEMEILRGEIINESEYDSKCPDCDEHDTLEYCEDCENNVCSTCGFGTSEEGCSIHPVEANV